MRPIKKFLALAFLLYLPLGSQAQKADTWSNVPPASDDRFTNPKSAIYAGPNGWWNFGEVRAEGASNPTLKYSFKGGLTTNSAIFMLNPSDKLQILSLNFGTEAPLPGTYQMADKPDPANKKVVISLSDVANKAIKSWSGEGGGGTISVTKLGDFYYFKARNLLLQPHAIHNQGDSKQPLKVGIEGAYKP